MAKRSAKKPAAKRAPAKRATAKRKPVARKPRKQKPPQPQLPAGSDPLIEDLLLQLVRGCSADQAERLAIKRLDVDPQVAGLLVTEARRRLTIAADYSRDEVLATGIERLNAIYQAGLDQDDLRTSLAAQKELHKLFALYHPLMPGAASPPGEQIEELEAVRAHLEALDLGNEVTATEELARRAAAEIITHRATK